MDERGVHFTNELHPSGYQSVLESNESNVNRKLSGLVLEFSKHLLFASYEISDQIFVFSNLILVYLQVLIILVLAI